jgi:Fic family protein
MSYEPQFTISSDLLNLVEKISSLRERIQGASVDLSWIPALQKDTRTRNVHASTAIEGNPLTLEQVRALEEGRELEASDQRSEREVTNYFAGLRFVEKNAGLDRIRHDHLFDLHRILAGEVMDQGQAGAYRTIGVRVGNHFPPNPSDVSPLMFELLTWWNDEATKLSPILSSAILHYRFEDIHPFADGNGRTGRALSLWELYRRGFDTHHIFSVDEYYWEDRPGYYAALDQVRRDGEDLSRWLEYSARGLHQTLERVWLRVQRYQSKEGGKITLTPKQERLLQLLRDHGSLAPSEIWDLLSLSKQGAMNVITPLLAAGLIIKKGSKKTGKYYLQEG